MDCGAPRKWLSDACRQPLLAKPGQVQPQLAVHAPQQRLAPRLLLVTSAVVQQIKAMAWIESNVALDEGNHPGFIARHGPEAQRRTGKAAGNASSAPTHAVAGHERLHD